MHSTPLVVSLKPTSVESVPARLSFDRSQCSLPPLELGEEDARSLPSVGVPTPAATSSVAGPVPQTSTPASALQLTADHTKTIFNLACEGRHLKEQIAREFLKLSSGEVLFRTQAQSTSHEALVSTRPERFSTLYQILRSDEEPPDVRDKAMQEIVDAANRAWSRANETLFQHVIDYEEKLNAFLTKVGGWIREQEERIWTVIFQIVEDTGAPVCAFLDILFPSFRYTAFTTSESFLPKSITTHLRVLSRGLRTTLVGASQLESPSSSIFRWRPKGQGRFEGGHHP